MALAAVGIGIWLCLRRKRKKADEQPVEQDVDQNAAARRKQGFNEAGTQNEMFEIGYTPNKPVEIANPHYPQIYEADSTPASVRHYARRSRP